MSADVLDVGRIDTMGAAYLIKLDLAVPGIDRYIVVIEPSCPAPEPTVVHEGPTMLDVLTWVGEQVDAEIAAERAS